MGPSSYARSPVVRRMDTPTRSTPYQLPTPSLSASFCDPARNSYGSSPSSPRTPVFSPNYQRSSAVYGPRGDNTPRRPQSPAQLMRARTPVTRTSQRPDILATSYNNMSHPTTPTHAPQAAPSPSSHHSSGVSSVVRARPRASSGSFVRRKDPTDMSMCSSNGVSHSTSDSIDTRRAPAKSSSGLASTWSAYDNEIQVRREVPLRSAVVTQLNFDMGERGVDRGQSGHFGSKPSNTSRSMLKQFVSRWCNKHQENQQAYKEGGYLNVRPGTVLRHRYVIIHKLGWGEFSTVWLAYDKRAEEQRHTFVAVKIARCHANVLESSKYEVNLLKFLRGQLPRGAPTTQLLDYFEHKAEYGSHLCMVMPVCGSNLLCIIDQVKGRRQRRRDKEINMVKEITSSLLRGLVDLEAINVIHTDLKPENVLVAAPDPKVASVIQSFLSRNADVVRHVDPVVACDEGDPNNLVSLADFGLSVLLEPPTTDNAAAQAVGTKKGFRVSRPGIVNNSNGTLIQTREYRAPEILLGTDFCPRTDVWSVGCMVYELITGDFLMDPKRKATNERDMDVEHLAMIMQILGPVPSRIATSGKSSRPPRFIHRYFSEDGRFLFADKYRSYPRRSIAAELEVYLEPAEAERAAQFIMSCFTYDPMERCHAADLLNHSWLRTMA